MGTDTLNIEFEIDQEVEITDEEHEYFGSVGVITRLVGDNFYIIELEYVEGDFEVSGEQIMPCEYDEVPF
jgi:hypothetical protein